MPSIWTEGGLTSLAAAAAAAAAAAGSAANNALLFSELAAAANSSMDVPADDSSRRFEHADQQMTPEHEMHMTPMTPDELIDYISKEFSGPLGENTSTQTAARKLLMMRRYFAEFPFTKTSLVDAFTHQANMLAFVSNRPLSCRPHCIKSE